VDSDGERSAGAGAPVSSSDGSAALAGVVSELLPSGLYRVRLDEGVEIVAHVADRIDRNFVRLLVGDHVRVELSKTDRRRGRITGKI
jgi:translation initiation factor IF-1